MSWALLYRCLMWRFLSLRLSFCCLLFVTPYLFSLLSFSPPYKSDECELVDGEEAQKLGTEACLFTMLRMNICLVKKKKRQKERRRRRKGGKETVVLMLLEQQPTRMTKLRLKPFSPQLDSHECWKIEIVFCSAMFPIQVQMPATGFVNLQCNLYGE